MWRSPGGHWAWAGCIGAKWSVCNGGVPACIGEHITLRCCVNVAIMAQHNFIRHKSAYSRVTQSSRRWSKPSPGWTAVACLVAAKDDVVHLWSCEMYLLEWPWRRPIACLLRWFYCLKLARTLIRKAVNKCTYNLTLYATQRGPAAGDRYKAMWYAHLLWLGCFI